MTIQKYDIEDFKEASYEDDGTMTRSAEELQKALIGKKIVSVEKRELTDAEKAIVEKEEYGYLNTYLYGGEMTILTLSDQTIALLIEIGDCCAYTSLDVFKLLDTDHVITGVGTTDGFNKWFIYAEDSVVATADVSWSCGNPFYYGYGFEIKVLPLIIQVAESSKRKEITDGS